MERVHEAKNIRGGRRRAALLGAGLSLIALSGCGETSSDDATTAPTSASAAPAPQPGAPIADHCARRSIDMGPSNVSMTFDDLGGGSDIIRVYPDPSARGRECGDANIGTYRDGQAAAIICKVVGRVVHADTAVGERAASSDVWFGIGDPQDLVFATKVYAEPIPAKQVEGIPVCPPV